MPSKKQRKSPVTVPTMNVGQFYERHAQELKLELSGSDCGYDRQILEPTINRPGLALSGFFTYFAVHRIQVIGKAERSYLKHLSRENAEKRFFALCQRKIPCIVVSRGDSLPKNLIEVANRAGISIFKTSMVTMNFINAATVRMEWDFAPSSTEHGCMVDVMGIGILIRGDSGTGKSETVLALLRRGASLVADDMVRIRNIEGRELIGTAPELGRSHMEVRGLGIINVAALFGVATVRTEKRLDLIVTLKHADELEEMDRLGMDRKKFELLGIKVPLVELPVAPGRDMAQLVEVAALDQKLKTLGHDSAAEFNKKLLKRMQEGRTKLS